MWRTPDAVYRFIRLAEVRQGRHYCALVFAFDRRLRRLQSRYCDAPDASKAGRETVTGKYASLEQNRGERRERAGEKGASE